MTLRNRLDKLETLVSAGEGLRPCNILFLDEDDRILWDATEEMRAWAGRHVGEWPPEWRQEPWPIQTIVGVDPLEMFGVNHPRSGAGP